MSELDVIKLQKLLKSTRIKRLLKDKKVSLSILASLISLPIGLKTTNNSIQALLMFIVGYECQLLKRYWHQASIPEEKILITALEQTETYKICLEEYDKYITEVAKFIKSLGLKSSKEIVVYLYELLSSGLFSKNHRHKYQQHAYETEYLVKLCGARVLTGETVCRHQAAFFRDILNKLEIPSACMSVTTTTSNPIRLAKSKYINWNHAVVGISTSKGMYMFDTTSGRFCSKPTTIEFKEPESILVSEYSNLTQEPNKYLIMNPHENPLNFNHSKQFQRIINSKQMEISNGEVEYLRNKIGLIYKRNYQEHYNFFIEQEENREFIEKLYNELCPYGDKPIKKWLIKK